MTIASTRQDKAQLLRLSLLVNSIFCFLCGIDAIVFSNNISKFLGIKSSTPILILGIGLVLYAFDVYLQSRKRPLSLFFAGFAIGADVLWVITSAILIFSDLYLLTINGKRAIAIIADIVLVFALTQYVGIRRLRSL